MVSRGTCLQRRAEGGHLSTYQQPGGGYRPLALAGDPTLDALVEQRAPVTLRQYVAPLGNGWHLIRRDCNEAPYEASSSTGATFRAGETVAVIGEAGLRGEIIIGPAATATADYPTVAVALNLALDIPAPAAGSCPSSLTGRSYLAVVDENKVGLGGGPETLWAYIYNDGSYGSTVASYDYSGDGITLASDPTFQHVGDGKVLFTASGLGADTLVCVWDTDTNTLAIAECAHPDFVNTICAAMWDGSTYAYFFMEYGASNPRALQMYRVTLGASGPWDEVTARVGATFETDSAAGLAPSENIIGLGGAAYLVPTLNYAESPEIETALAFSAGEWAEVPPWHSYVNDLSLGNGANGFPISGGRGQRATFAAGFAPLLGASPAGGPEVSLLPLDWQPGGGFTNLHTSPSGAEFVVLVAPDQFIRLPVSGVAALGECPIPGITIEPSPEDFIPGHFLCLDH